MNFMLRFIRLINVFNGEIEMTKESIVRSLLNDMDSKVSEEKDTPDIGKIIKALIDTDIGGSNEEQFKFVQLLKGLAGSSDPKSTEFLQALSKFITAENFSDFVKSNE